MRKKTMKRHPWDSEWR